MIHVFLDWKIIMCPADNNIDTVVEPSTATMTSARGARLSSHNTGLYATGTNYAKPITDCNYYLPIRRAFYVKSFPFPKLQGDHQSMPMLEILSIISRESTKGLMKMSIFR